MKTQITILICVTLSFLSVAQTKKDVGKNLPGKFGTLKYDKIIAYDFNGKTNNIVRLGKVIDSIVIKKVILNQRQIDTLNSFLFNTATYGTHIDDNFIGSKFGIVYFSGDKVVGHISVSLEDNYLTANFDIPALSYIKLQQQGYYVAGAGFSKSGRKKIKIFCKELGFRYGDYDLDTKLKK